MSDSNYVTIEELRAGAELTVECGPRRYRIRRLTLEEIVLCTETLPVGLPDGGKQARRKPGTPVDADPKGVAQQNAKLISMALLAPKISPDDVYVIPGADFAKLLLAIQDLCSLNPPFAESPPDSEGSS